MTNRRIRPERAYEPKAIDAVDRRILVELQANARLSLAELGRRVGLSAPSVAERVQRLEDTGVITGYRAEVDPRALGFPLMVIVRVRPAVRQLPRIAMIAREIPEIVECYRMTGEDCFHLTMHLRAIDELEPILDRFTPFGRTTTSIVQSAPVPRRPVTPDEPASPRREPAFEDAPPL
ncbi:Lrp/AsnC family transcriptional regulator [Microbispora sp. NPDC049125]|uniref:Lrp/AsnC family transcriptional regulator n=1 Tax=Microbispora sp. NPDC049125 TaxID=3154929 RepID=UPI0034669EFB